jgi:predicted nucleic-acid-binding Zn-ribbon protein
MVAVERDRHPSNAMGARYDPGMKNTHRCPKCHHDRILYIARVADRVGDTEYTMPMRIAHYQVTLGRVLGFAASTTKSAGELEAGVCPRCGYTELYTKEPESIVVDGVNVRELVATS